MNDEICATGYRRLPARTRRWAPWPIARTALALAFGRTSAKVVAALAAFVVVSHGATLVGQVLLGKVSAAADTGMAGALMLGALSSAVGQVQDTLSTFIGVQLYTTALVLAVVAPGLIAEDRRTRAFELYFSRPLRPVDYAIGKALVPLLVTAATMVVPFVGLFVLAVGIAPPALADELWPLFLPGLIGATLGAAVLCATLLGASALGERGRTVGVAYLLAFGGLGAFADGMAQAGYAWAGYFGPFRNVQTVTDALLHATAPKLLAMIPMRAQTNPSPWLSSVGLAVLVGAGVLALVARLRKEVRG